MQAELIHSMYMKLCSMFQNRMLAFRRFVVSNIWSPVCLKPVHAKKGGYKVWSIWRDIRRTICKQVTSMYEWCPYLSNHLERCIIRQCCMLSEFVDIYVVIMYSTWCSTSPRLCFLEWKVTSQLRQWNYMIGRNLTVLQTTLPCIHLLLGECNENTNGTVRWYGARSPNRLRNLDLDRRLEEASSFLCRCSWVELSTET